jgi:Glycosyl hydrolases family 15
MQVYHIHQLMWKAPTVSPNGRNCYCWLRDAAFTLMALMHLGYYEEARAWRDWLLRAVAGSPRQIQIMYGVGGERRLPEQILPWLPGYENSSPVRVGNDASQQLQLDVFGEVADMFQTLKTGMAQSERGRALWEIRGLDDGTFNAIAGPERVVLRTSASLYGEDLKTLGEFTVETGQPISRCRPEARCSAGSPAINSRRARDRRWLWLLHPSRCRLPLARRYRKPLASAGTSR